MAGRADRTQGNAFNGGNFRHKVREEIYIYIYVYIYIYIYIGQTGLSRPRKDVRHWSRRDT